MKSLEFELIKLKLESMLKKDLLKIIIYYDFKFKKNSTKKQLIKVLLNNYIRLGGSATEPTRLEKVFFAPGRNQDRINNIKEGWKDIIKDQVHFSMKYFINLALGPYIIESSKAQLKGKAAFDYVKELSKNKDALRLISASGMIKTRFQKGFSSDKSVPVEIFDSLKELVEPEKQIIKKYRILDYGVYIDTRGSTNYPPGLGEVVVNNSDVDEYLKRIMPIYIKFIKYIKGDLNKNIDAAQRRDKQLDKEEANYQERLQGFRKGWVFGTIGVQFKQTIESVLNDPKQRKIFLSFWSKALGLVPGVGPVISIILDGMAEDPNFDIGEFLKELFKMGAGKFFKLLAQMALNKVLPPGLAPNLVKIITKGSEILAQKVGSQGANIIVNGIDPNKDKKLNDSTEQALKEVKEKVGGKKRIRKPAMKKNIKFSDLL